MDTFLRRAGVIAALLVLTAGCTTSRGTLNTPITLLNGDLNTFSKKDQHPQQKITKKPVKKQASKNQKPKQ